MGFSFSYNRTSCEWTLGRFTLPLFTRGNCRGWEEGGGVPEEKVSWFSCIKKTGNWDSSQLGTWRKLNKKDFLLLSLCSTSLLNPRQLCPMTCYADRHAWSTKWVGCVDQVLVGDKKTTQVKERPHQNIFWLKGTRDHRLCQFLTKIIPVINWVVTCIKTSVSNGGLGMCQPNDFYLRVFTFWFDTEKTFQVILGLL